MAKTKNFEMSEAEHWIVRLAAKDAAGIAYDLTGGSAQWAISVEGGGLVAMFAGTIFNATEGLVDFVVSPEQHEDIPDGEYIYEIRVTTADSIISVQLRGSITVTESPFNSTLTDLADNAVGTQHIQDNAVTNAKLADMESPRFKGRLTAGLGDPEDLTGMQGVSVLLDATEEIELADAATIAVDLATFINGTVTLAGNRTLGQPANAVVGQSGVIRIVQDGTGSRTLAYHADWEFADGTPPTLSTAAGAEDLLFYQVIGANRVFGSLVLAIA